jgi:hypothetical protein
MTQAERNVIEAALSWRDGVLQEGPFHDDVIRARDELSDAIDTLCKERQDAYWREVGQ